ncbi:MAG: hypothetical protein A2X77_03845 [Gammaproteobacteria bacterium GWE2_42_36]|nr:MAG: hypothetical protein A2X77_03845 [Gammaproteobacteria bacterium GWE2_42_36]HCU05711.1 hypothetical protein [Coxiellaceae bacterium]
MQAVQDDQNSETWRHWLASWVTENKLPKATFITLSTLFVGIAAWVETMGTEQAVQGEVAKALFIPPAMIPEGIEVGLAVKKIFNGESTWGKELQGLLLNGGAFTGNGLIEFATLFFIAARRYPELLEIPVLPQVLTGIIAIGAPLFSTINGYALSLQATPTSALGARDVIKMGCTGTVITCLLGSLGAGAAIASKPVANTVGAALSLACATANLVTAGTFFRGRREGAKPATREDKLPLIEKVPSINAV